MANVSTTVVVVVVVVAVAVVVVAVAVVVVVGALCLQCTRSLWPRLWCLSHGFNATLVYVECWVLDYSCLNT